MPNQFVDQTEFETRLRAELSAKHGEVLNARQLADSLGYPSTTALHRAIKSGRLEIPTFRIPQRRGVFALASEVASSVANWRANFSHAGRSTALQKESDVK